MKDKFLDIERLIKGKNPKLYRWIPRFILRFLKRKLHEDDVNKFLNDAKGLKGYDFSKKVVNEFNIKVIANGLEKIPKSGGVILVLNHPLGGMDAITLITEFNTVRQDYKFVVNDILLNLENLKDLFVGINKHGANTKESLEALNKVFESEQAVFVYPAGLVSRKKKGRVEDLEWKKTFVTRSKKFKRDVIPVYIDGELSKFFYRLANFRTKIGIKANIEMLYLIDELYKQVNKTIRVSFGDPIPYSTFDKSKKDFEWAQWVKKEVYKMKTT